MRRKGRDLVKYNIWQRNLRALRRKNKVCQRCGKVRVVDSKSCKKCILTMKEHRYRRRSSERSGAIATDQYII